MRTACLLVPDLPLRAELRAHPDLAGQPFVVASGDDARAEVLAVSREAAREGVQAYSSVTHARAACADLRVRTASPALEKTARQTLLDIAYSFAPRAALAEREGGVFTSEAAVLIDASGVASLFHSEQGFAAALGARAEALGLAGSLAIASSHGIAHLVARQLASPLYAASNPATSPAGLLPTLVLPPGTETEFLAPLSIDLLAPDDRLAQRLTRFGVRTVRDLLRLPRRSLAQRLGPEILRLIARAEGREAETPLPEPSDLRFEEAIDLEYPAETLEPLGFILRGAVSRLAERLTARGLACGPLDLRLECLDRRRDARRVGVAAPTCDVKVLLRLITLSLESQPPPAAVESISLATSGLPVRRDQLDLFLPRGPDPAALDRTLAELESLCGSDRVGAPAVADDHRPGAFVQSRFEVGAPRRSTACHNATPVQPSPTASLPVRALRPPVAAEIRVAAGRPESIRSAVANGRVVHAAGPWRTTGRWWSEEERFALDHYDVQVSDGSVVRLCFDWLTRSWQIDAIYD